MPFVGGYKSKMRTAAIFEKSKNRHISATIQPIFTKFGTLVQFDPLGCCSTDFDKIWHADAIRPS